MNASETRRQVSEAYRKALHRTIPDASPGGCCASAPAPAGDEASREARDPAEGAARGLAGYGAELERFDAAAASSFGCGNPLAFSGVQEGETVLDLGSGAGFDLLIAAERVGPTGRVIGVDMTEAMIERARANVAAAGVDHVELRMGIIEDLPVDDASVDWVISNCVINLSPEKPKVFREIARVLRPGGHFSVSDIVAEDLPEWLQASSAAYAACVAGAIPEADYVMGLRDAGLVDVQISERLVYEADQVRAMAATEIEALALPAELVDRALDATRGKIASIKVTGRRPG